MIQLDINQIWQNNYNQKQANHILKIQSMGGNNQSKIQTPKVVILEPTVISQNRNIKVVPATATVVVNNPEKRQIIVQNIPNTEPSFSFKSLVQSITQSLLRVGPWIHNQKTQMRNSQFNRFIREKKQVFRTQVQQPLCKLYNTIPEKFTDAKFQLIDPYTQNQRFAALNILCALTAISTITTTRKIDPFSRLLRTTRNVGFMYLIGGLLIAPEIYNPFIRSY